MFPVRRYRWEGAADAVISFAEIPVAELAKHELFVAADMTKVTRKAILKDVGEKGRTHIIWAEKVPVGLHVVMSPGGLADVTSLVLAKAKHPTWCRAISLFVGGEYRLDMDASRERAVIRTLEVLGIPPDPRPPPVKEPADEESLSHLAP